MVLWMGEEILVVDCHSQVQFWNFWLWGLLVQIEMAIVGLHNVPVLESSILRESQSSSSGRQGNQGRISTRASSMLQMWRELEDECEVNSGCERGRSRLQQGSSYVMSHCPEGEGRVHLEVLRESESESENRSVNNLESHMGPMNENEDHQSMTSEQSQDFGEVERERVRQIFREWMNSGVTAQAPNVPHMNSSSRAQWLGEIERERVRVVREWIQMTSQQREACIGNREEQVTEIGSQIERVRDGQVLDHNEGQAENSRREIRRLCGRQALLDLLTKKELERRVELQGLEATRPVSCFAHRNRIQSLLRIRCFQSMRSAESSRSNSAAESELGLLRQRQTVTGLREGFLSRLDNSIHVQAGNLDSPSDNNVDVLRDGQAQTSSGIEVLACDLEQHDFNGDGNVSSSAVVSQLTRCAVGESDSHVFVAQGAARLDHAIDTDEESRQETPTTSDPNGSLEDEDPPLNSFEPSRSESGEFNDFEEGHEMSFLQYNTGREEISTHNLPDDVEGDVSEDINGHESSILVEDWHEQVVEYEEREWEDNVLSSQWRDDNQGETERHLWHGDDEESSSGDLENDAGVQNDAQEDYWHESGAQETPRNWLEMPSGPGATSGRVDTYYFSDDDNVYNMELRELVNRRRVSSLLHSGFRESLDQLIQSYVERQTHAPEDWELHEMSSRDQEQLDTDHNEESDAAEGSHQMPPTPPPVPHAQWGQVLHHRNRARHEIRQRPGTEWETINDLRIDMARLQQRLNNMQRMLEACMDMQLELQRSVRQEVSAALNRPNHPSESLENMPAKDSFKWDCIRRGVCCMCSDNNIDSLLYRCGHMCTCTKCANILVQGHGKCPMCQAPVVEAIRAYFIE